LSGWTQSKYNKGSIDCRRLNPYFFCGGTAVDWRFVRDNWRARMESRKACKAAGVTILGAIGLVVGLMILRGIPEMIRYMKISRF
jgi:hypothetical protein